MTSQRRAARKGGPALLAPFQVERKCMNTLGAAFVAVFLALGGVEARAHGPDGQATQAATPPAAPATVANPAVANRYGAGYFPNVPLITQDGKTVRFYDDLLKGKSVAVNIIYTSCKDECPLETARLA